MPRSATRPKRRRKPRSGERRCWRRSGRRELPADNSSTPRQASAQSRGQPRQSDVIGETLRSRAAEPSRPVNLDRRTGWRDAVARSAPPAMRSAGDHAKRAVERAEYAIKLLAAAQNVTGRRDYAVGALPASKPRILLDAINGEFAGAAENGEHSPVLEKIDGVITPLAGGDLAAVKAENAVKLAPAEGDLACGGGRAQLAPAKHARFSFAECHAAPPVSLKLHGRFMIAPDARVGKRFAREKPRRNGMQVGRNGRRVRHY